jgi:hypothetical protein
MMKVVTCNYNQDCKVAQPASHDFDFFFGSWRVHNRRLLKRLNACTEWETFEATQTCFPVLDGLGNTDQMNALDNTPIGMSLRFFKRETAQWHIHWVSYSDGVMQPPVIGTFMNGVGTFEGVDIWETKLIIVRFLWTNIHTPTPRWEQFFSPDRGQSWEKNWEMNFTRIAEAAKA